MNEPIDCPCSSNRTYESCCQAFHEGTPAPSALQLMRSRYAAYALCLPDYLIQTTHPSKRKGLNRQEIIDWSQENKWLLLEICKSSTSIVEFKAHFSDKNGTQHVHHELSTFSNEKGKWFYVKGTFF